MPNSDPLTHDEFHLWNKQEFATHANQDDERYRELQKEVALLATNFNKLLTQLRTALIVFGALAAIISALAGMIWLDRDKTLRETVEAVTTLRDNQITIATSQSMVVKVLDRQEARDKMLVDLVLEATRLRNHKEKQ